MDALAVRLRIFCNVPSVASGSRQTSSTGNWPIVLGLLGENLRWVVVTIEAAQGVCETMKRLLYLRMMAYVYVRTLGHIIYRWAIFREESAYLDWRRKS